MHQQRTAFENIVGKGEIAHNEQFLLFPQCFLPNQIIVSLFGAGFEKPKNGISGLIEYGCMSCRLCFDPTTFLSCFQVTDSN